MTQIGYGIGLLLIVPLGDLVENRMLVLSVVSLGALALLAAAFASDPFVFFIAALLVGLGSVAVQILLPFAAHLAAEAVRGRVVGNVMVGLMIGILLARPVSSFIAALTSWRVVYLVSAALTLLVAAVLHRTLPRRVPVARVAYGELLASMLQLFRTMPMLRRRALYQSCLFAGFCLYWTTVPLLLLGPAFRFTQGEVALFALAGVAGAFAAPIAGRVADWGWSRLATGVAMAMVALGFLITLITPMGSALSIGVLAAAAMLIDFGAQGNVVLGYRAIFTLGAEYRGRLNGVYMASFFTAGALGSAIGAWAYAQGGWSLAAWIGLALALFGLIALATE
jgi:predicted MFS family arabinose efflux permease